MQNKMKQWILIGSGGALGTLSRATIAELLIHSNFPVSTLIVNLLGSLLLGGMTAFLYIRSHNTVHLIFGIGFCGSFTTMSMFAADATTLLTAEAYIDVIWYIGVSVLGGLLLAAFGFYIIKNLLEKRASQ